MNHSTTTRTLPPAITRQLESFRRRVRWIKWLEGLLAAAFGLLLSWFGVFFLDRLMETPGWLRGLMLAAGVAVPGLLLPLVWHRWVWSQRRLEDVARLVRRRFPRLGDQLLGTIELAHADTAALAGRSERLVQAAIDQAATAIEGRDLAPAVPNPRHRRWAIAAGSVGAFALAALLLVPGASFNAMARWLMPWADTDRYTFARIQPLPDELVVPYAEPFDLPAVLADDTRWTPGRASARVDRQPRLDVSADDQQFPFQFPPQIDDAGIAFRVGDERARVGLKPRTRPEMTTLRARLRLPDYLQYTHEPEIDVRGGSVRLLEGAEVSWVAEASRELEQGTVDGEPQPVDGNRLVTHYLPVAETRDWSFHWLDQLGLSPRDPVNLTVHAVEDEPPMISARRESIQQVVLVNEVITFDLSAQDDFGLRRVGLEWWGADRAGATNGQRAHGERIAAAGEPEKRDLQTRATFNAERDGVVPQTIQVRAWAEDYLPGRERSYSAPFVLQVLDPTDHAMWLTDRFSEWMQAARETYEREQQLHQTNLELRDLTPEDLDRPENRRQLARQAAEEQANAARLDALTDIGQNLVEQATRNDEFEADRLESWAELLENLDDIAANRMPSVAELLRESSSATAADPGEPSPGEPGEATAGDPSAGDPTAGDPSAGDSSPGEPGEAAAGDPSMADAGDSMPGDPSAGGEPGDPNAALADALAEAAAGGDPSGDPAGDPSGESSGDSSGDPSGEASEGGEAGASEESPSVTQGDPDAGASGGGESEEAPPVPSVADHESGFLEPVDPGDSEGGGGPGALGLPQTTLGALPGDDDEDGAPSPPASPAQEQLDAALDEQRDLLAEFAKVADELSELLSGFEASTFVKRLKTASRAQLDIASALTSDTLDAFGLEDELVPEPSARASADLAAEAREQSDIVGLIQSDLAAFINRNPELRFTTLLQEMRDAQVVRELASLSDITDQNYSGRSIAGSQYWADTLDRWAENLVAAPDDGGEGEGEGESENVPPEVILKMMQALRAEIDLREATREVDNARPALSEEEFANEANQLAETQYEVAYLVGDAIDILTHEPQGPERFQNEIALLTRVAEVMVEARDILGEPHAGSRAIAAETEAIELLLQANRSAGGGGGGGGGSPGGGGTAERSTASALARLGEGSEADTEAPERSVGQATGRAGREFPEEFRSGLDAYFNALESPSGGTSSQP